MTMQVDDASWRCCYTMAMNEDDDDDDDDEDDDASGHDYAGGQ